MFQIKLLCFLMNSKFSGIAQIWLQQFDRLLVHLPLESLIRTRLAWLDIPERLEVDAWQILEFLFERAEHHVLGHLQWWLQKRKVNKSVKKLRTIQVSLKKIVNS